MTWYNVVFHGDDGHANTKPMWGRRDTLAASAKLVYESQILSYYDFGRSANSKLQINEIENLAYEMNGFSTTTGIHSYPFGSCNIQSKTKVVFCLMHKLTAGLEEMGQEIEKRIKAIAGSRGLEFDMKRDIHLPPGDFWPEAIDWYLPLCEFSIFLFILLRVANL